MFHQRPSLRHFRVVRVSFVAAEHQPVADSVNAKAENYHFDEKLCLKVSLASRSNKMLELSRF